MSGLVRDIRYALRQLRKAPGFTAVVVVTLALGIGATTAIFTVVYDVLLRPLSYEKPNQIVRLWEVNGPGQQVNFTDPNFEDIRSQNHSLQGLAEFRSGLESVSGTPEAARIMVASVSRDFFSIMRVSPVLGRGFVPEDQRFGAIPVALVSNEYWRQRLNAASDLSTLKLTIEDQSVSVIGILPPGFSFPDKSEIWLPRELFERLPSRTAHNWQVVGRLRDGVPIETAHAELAAIARQIKQQYGPDVDMTNVAFVRLQDAMTGNMRPALMVLLAAVGLLLLIACANVTNLLFAKAIAREREFAIRAALGATRGRLVMQFVIESLLLSLAGGAVGVVAARWGVIALVRLAPPELARVSDVSIHVLVLLFAVGVSLTLAVVLGVFSALRTTSTDVRPALAEHGGSKSGAPRTQGLGRAIVSGQLAITLLLLTGAGLLGRSLLRVLSIDPGFQTEHVVTMDLALSFADKDVEKTRRVQFLNELFTKMSAIPGVTEVGGTGRLPFTPPLSDGTYVIMPPGEQPPAAMEELEKWSRNATRTGYANYRPVSEGYFSTLEIPLLRGRLFGDSDTMSAPHVAVISQSLAREKWPDQNPLGQTIEFGNMDGDLRPLTIVGVVGDVREDSLERPPSPTIYVNYRQRPQATYQFAILMRTVGDPSTVISSARTIVREIDPTVPPTFGTFTQVLASSLKSRRFNLLLVGAFGSAALLLAIAGLYGVMAYAVTRRTSEFGIRMALGASSGNIRGIVLKQGLVVATTGVVIGIVSALALTRVLRSLLFGLSATDPATFAAVAALLIFVALFACYIPARRATKVDPMVALRYE
jgi:putative ABC transport system permease protein